MEKLENAWASTCRTILGGEIGPLKAYEAYLQKYVPPVRFSKSELSGKKVAFTGDYPEGVKAISNDEMAEYQEVLLNSKLDINEIKDIDSILNSVSEKLYYTGNTILGKSREVSGSNRVIDSHYVYNSHEIFRSQYVAYSYIMNHSRYMFGTQSVGEADFGIQCHEVWRTSPMMECLIVYNSSYCLYSANLDNCTDCIFCFNLRSARRCIGNLELSREKYNHLKAKLQEDIRTTLESKKELPIIMEIIGEAGNDARD
jgi:hypothetical protein